MMLFETMDVLCIWYSAFNCIELGCHLACPAYELNDNKLYHVVSSILNLDFGVFLGFMVELIHLSFVCNYELQLRHLKRKTV